MSNFISVDTLKAAVQRGKEYTGEKFSELANATAEAIEEALQTISEVKSLGLYLDEDGDIAQRDEEDNNAEEEEGI